MKTSIFIVLMAVFLSSCAKLEYLDQALTLKAYSEEKDAQEKMVEAQQKKMGALFARIEKGDLLPELRTSDDLLNELGRPVLVEPNGQGSTRWLYRDPVKYFNTPKVYFYLDADGRVTGWEPSGIMIHSHEEIRS